MFHIDCLQTLGGVDYTNLLPYIEGYPQNCLTVFPRILDGLFSFQNSPKDLDPSYKMDLDLWDC